MDKTIDILKLWIYKHGKSYNHIHQELTPDKYNILYNETLGEWSDNRFRHVITLREKALTHAKKVWADFLFVSV